MLRKSLSDLKNRQRYSRLRELLCLHENTRHDSVEQPTPNNLNVKNEIRCDEPVEEKGENAPEVMIANRILFEAGGSSDELNGANRINVQAVPLIADLPDYKDDDNQIPQQDNSEQLYRNAPLTITESMLLILTLVINHNLHASCIADISLINFHCLKEGLKKNSLYKFKKFFNFQDSEITKHYYCSICLRNLRPEIELCPSCPDQKNSYFVQLPFLDQLAEMFQSNANNISSTWYTDGVPVFKSSKISVWPLYLTINELPFEERKKKSVVCKVGLLTIVERDNVIRKY